MTVDQVLAVIRAHRYTFSDEEQLQAGVALALAGHGFEREIPLGRGLRVDLLHGESGIGIECKVKGTPSEVARQCQAYLARFEIRSLILVTSRSQHSRYLPEEVRFVFVGGLG